MAASSDGEGRGSELTVCLPLRSARPHAVAGASPAPLAAPLRVLVVEDNVDAADTLGALLELLGHRVKVSYDARAGSRSTGRSCPR